MTKKNGKKKVSNTIKWILVAFLLCCCMVYWFSFSSVLFALLAIALLPVASLQRLIDRIMPEKKILRGIIAVAIFVVGCCATPQPEAAAPEMPLPTEDTTEIIATAEPATEATTPATESPSQPTTEPTVLPTTLPVTEPTAAPETEPATEPPTAPPTEPTVAPAISSFEIHFIDVGQADAALVLCDGQAMLIDGGNVADSSLLYSYLKKHEINHLDYVIGTHAHEDHIGGLAGALNYASVGKAYCPATTYDTDAFGNFVKALAKHNVPIAVPSVNDKFTLGSATCTILAVNTDMDDPNNTSIVLRIAYGETSFLFTGDAEREVEQAILNRGAEIASTVLKVGHHGSDTSTSYVWLREIMPRYAVISVGKDNSYGHPTEEVLSRLRDAEVKTFRTDLQGDVICVSDGTDVIFTVERNADVDVFGDIGENSTQQATPPETEPPAATEETEDNGRDYVVNTNTDKFHYPSCSSAKQIKDKNRWDYHGTREELIDMGYEPCKRCNP